MSTNKQQSVVFIVYETDSSNTVIVAHRLFMTLMLHGYTARMLQSHIADPEKRKAMIENALRTADVVVRLESDVDADAGVLLTEQLEMVRQLDKPMIAAALPIDEPALLAQLNAQSQSLTMTLPEEAKWVAGSWRLKFFNEGTLAHGYGILKLQPDGTAQGELNIAQGTTALNTKIAAKWSLEGKNLTLNGLQQVQGLPTRLEYKLEMEIQQYNGNAEDGAIAFSVKTAQGDDGVLQREPTVAPKSA
ncbi:MAG: hypothetical protein U0528_00450 [Anaerolineae bacterium]